MGSFDLFELETKEGSPLRDWLARNWLVLVLLCCACLFFGFGAWFLRPGLFDQDGQVYVVSGPIDEGTFESEERDSSKPAIIYVDVEGAVGRPGVVVVDSQGRIEDALVAAGGILSEADGAWVSKNLNRAALLHDGFKIYIPFASEEQYFSLNDGFVHINSDSKEVLMTISGVGEVTAGKIIAGRPYGRLEELLEQKILSKSVWEANSERLRL